MESTHTYIAAVSFARTPLAEVTPIHDRILAAGWEEDEDGRGDPWVTTYRKHGPGEGRGMYREIQEIMGNYWINADEIEALLKNASNAASAS